jgi:hypothetical protein
MILKANVQCHEAAPVETENSHIFDGSVCQWDTSRDLIRQIIDRSVTFRRTKCIEFSLVFDIWLFTSTQILPNYRFATWGRRQSPVLIPRMTKFLQICSTLPYRYRVLVTHLYVSWQSLYF